MSRSVSSSGEFRRFIACSSLLWSLYARLREVVSGKERGLVIGGGEDGATCLYAAPVYLGVGEGEGRERRKGRRAHLEPNTKPPSVSLLREAWSLNKEV